MNSKILTLSGALLLSASVPALADDGHFDGFYAGGEAGYNEVKYKNEDLDFDIDADGLNYGGFAGFRQQTSSGLVVGLEGHYKDSEASIGDDDASLDFDRQVGVDALIGTTVGTAEQVLLFAFAGYENARLTASFLDEEESTDLDGVRVGGGAEFALSDNMSLRTTVAYTDYEEDVSNIEGTAGFVLDF
ncbi:porin family protein [Emcibacter sp.]|uniref:porin family protein n=1 Tax=Emcibacter sp. TaxID=1979954 RepID=UPI003A8E84EA